MTSSIIVPSNYWRNYIINNLKLNPNKIITTYEAVDPSFEPPLQAKRGNLIPSNYILYTGNLYPHKNIIVVFKALQKLPHLKLKIICARDTFAKKAIATTKYLNIDSQVEFLGYVEDQKFKKLYSKALALVHPALLEGFSLTGLEAMALNCPVISSDSSCLPEIYGDSVLYFDPNNSSDLVKQILHLQKSNKLRQQLLKLGHIQLSKYSWTKTATETVNFYNQNL